MKRHVEEIPTVTAATLPAAVHQVRQNTPEMRIVRLSVQGKIYWMKQVEQHGSLRKRLRKGDAADALRREADNLSNLAANGIPVPEVMDAGDGYLVLEDSGLTINDLYLSEDYDTRRDQNIYHAVGRALARLHSQGMALKRGHPRDYCWDGEAVRFIDLETKLSPLDPKTNGRSNIYNFVFFTLRIGYKVNRDAYPEAKAFLEGYYGAQSGEATRTLAAANRWARLQWFWAACNFSVGLLGAPNRFAKAKATALTIMMLRHFQIDALE